MDCGPPGSSVHGILQARTLEGVAISFSRGSSWPRDRSDQIDVSCIRRQILYHWATKEIHFFCILHLYHSVLFYLFFQPNFSFSNSNWSFALKDFIQKKASQWYATSEVLEQDRAFSLTFDCCFTALSITCEPALCWVGADGPTSTGFL